MNLRTYLMIKRAAYYGSDELDGLSTEELADLVTRPNTKFSPKAQTIIDREKPAIDDYINNGPTAKQKGFKLPGYVPGAAGATLAGAAGAGLGYAGSSWLAKKLGLKGRKALAAKLLGTVGLGAAAAYGGSRLGNYAGKKYLG